MQATHVEAIDQTIQKTNEWLRDLETKMGSKDRRHAYQVLRATLHALRDRLIPDEAAHLGAQLPTLIRGVYYDGWKPAGKPVRIKSVDEFLGAVVAELGSPKLASEASVRAVFEVLAERVSEGEINDVRSGLPEPLRALFPAAKA